MKFFGRKESEPTVEPGRKFEIPNYPDGGPYIDEDLYEYHHRKWDELDGEIKRRAVRFLQKELTPDNIAEWRKEIAADPLHWCTNHHMFAGMSFRNLLRKEIKDAELPTGNWDDYYAAALEAAVGVYQ